MRKILQALKYTLMGVIVVVLMVPVLLYVPWVQDLLVREAVGVLNRDSESLQFAVGHLRLSFPLRVDLRDLLISRPAEGDTVLYVGHLNTAIDNLPLNQNYIVVDEFMVESVRASVDSTLIGSRMAIIGSIDSLRITGVKYNPQGNEVRVGKIRLLTPCVSICHETDSVTEAADTTMLDPWFADLGRLDIEKARIGYNEWLLDSLDLHLKTFSLDSARIHFDTLNVTLPQSHLSASGDVDLAYLQDSTMGWTKLMVDAGIARHDLIKATGEALPNMRRYWPQRDVMLTCNLFASPDSLCLSPLCLMVPDYVEINANAVGSRPFDNSLRDAHAQLKGRLTCADSIMTALYATPSVRGFVIPDTVAFCVSATQHNADYSAEVTIDEEGENVAWAKGHFNGLTKAYAAEVESNGLDLRHFAPALGIGKVSAQVTADGRYFDFGKRRTSLDAKLNLDTLMYVHMNDSVSMTDTFAGVNAEARLVAGLYDLSLRSRLAQVQGEVELSGMYLADTLSARGMINLTVPEIGNFDSLYVDFASKPEQLMLQLQGGDALVNLEAACDVYKLADVADRVGRALDVQATNKAFNINELQKEIPSMMLNVDMQRSNPIMPVLAHYGVSFDRARIELQNTDSLHLDADLDSLNYNGIEVAAVCAQLMPNDGDYDYLGNATYIDTITGLTFDLGVKAYLDSTEIDAVGFVLVDSVPTVNFDAFLTDRLVADVFMDDLPVSVINTLLPSDFRMDGYLNAHASIDCDSVDFNAIDIVAWMRNGSLYYEGADMTIGLPNDSIRYDEGRMLFENVKCATQNGKPIVINGLVDISNDLTDPEINLRVTADNARLIRNSRRKTRRQFVYGKLPFSADVRISGKASDLIVDGRLDIPGGCDLTCYYEDDAVVSQSRLTDLVRFDTFGELAQPSDSLADVEQPMSLRRPKHQKGSQLVANLKLNIDKSTQALVYLPTNSDDRLLLRGGADLKLMMDAGGKLQLNGEFDVNGGDIRFKLPMLPMSKEFAMSSDSWLRWNGNPAEPELHLTATQQVRCTINDATMGARIVKFLVSVVISGTLENMDVLFDCSAPEDAAIASELASFTAEDRSRQALMLLIAQTYTGPSATSGSAGLSSANAALNTLLNKEIESLLTNKLKHTEINFDIDTYDATGTGAQQTDYSLSVSQNFFNDRVRVTVGGKMSRGDEVMQNQNQIINDVSFEWMIKKDGSHFLRLFRKTNFESVLEGQVIESGLGYVHQRNAYRFWQLFVPQGNKRQAAVREAIRQLQMAEDEKRQKQQERQPQQVDEQQKENDEKTDNGEH